MEKSENRRREMERQLLDKVGEVISIMNTANHVDQLISALHSISILLFPIDSSLLSPTVDDRYRDQILSVEAPCAAERSDWLQAFYRGPAFPVLARTLLLDVASNWLACFPLSAQKLVYDVFFVDGIVTEIVQILVPYIQHNRGDGFNVSVVQSNAGRLLVLSLHENNGVLQMAREFDISLQSEEFTSDQLRSAVTKAAQLVASIPDKAHLPDQSSLMAHSFFKQITLQLLSGAEEKAMNPNDFSLFFVGEMFSRICRRGSTDVLISEVTPRLLGHIKSFMISNIDSDVAELLESSPQSQFWLNIIEVVKDPYAVERICEQLLHQLVSEHSNDVEAYWAIWILFHHVFRLQTSVRSIFVDKFLLWKVFPLSCLRWILQFAIFEHPPAVDAVTQVRDASSFLDSVQRLAAVWSKRDFIQSASMEQQAYMTAALGLCLEKMSKENLDNSKDVMHSILQGVGCRLESPTHLIRRMASSIALVFSKVIDPQNPLYLDDSCKEETIDWEFGLMNPRRALCSTSNSTTKHRTEAQMSSATLREKDSSPWASEGIDNKVKGRNKKLSEFQLVDPDEIIDPLTLNYESDSDKDENDNASENSDSSDDSSLQPYDLSDDDTDLKRNMSQLVDVVAALRKSDDPEGVERALDVAEKLVRASPDELAHIAGDLTRSLIHVRCSDVAVDGEEESAEEKRQSALVALLVMSPFESLDALNKTLYSPNVDISQRIMILDVMTEAAQELASTKIMKSRPQERSLISNISEPQPWFLPSDIGPPGAGSWKEISGTVTGSMLSWTNTYERDLPLKPGQIKSGKTRRWSLRSADIQDRQIEWSQNKFPLYAAAFILPAMQGFDKKRHGVDLLGRDFIVLGKLIYMLGVCIKCASMHPEASVLAPQLLDMLRSRELCHHKEAYVRRAVLFAASCVLVALHPSFVASALVEGNAEVSTGLEWIRTWALHVADSDTDRECYAMAMSCLQLHAEMALRASRALESTESTVTAKNVPIALPSAPSMGTIKIPYPNQGFKLY